MKLSMPQKGFTWGKPMSLTDRPGHTRYTVTGDAYSLGKRLHVQDLAGRETIYIHQKLPSLLPTYEIEVYGRHICTIVKDITYLRPRYEIQPTDWSVTGSTSTFDYQITWQNTVIASCRPQSTAKGEVITYDFYDRTEELPALGIMLTINCILVQQESRYL